jgi:hypothetical protein
MLETFRLVKAPVVMLGAPLEIPFVQMECFLKRVHKSAYKAHAVLGD